MKSEKSVEQWAEEYLDSEEGKALSKKLEREFKDYVVFGINPTYMGKEIAEELKNFTIKNEEDGK